MSGWSTRETARCFGVLLLLALALHLSAFTVDVFNPDETYLATQARVLQDGGSLYEDAVDRKPPIVPYLYAGAFELTGSSSLVGPRVLAILAAALTALLVGLIARDRWGSRAAWCAGLLCLLGTVSLTPEDAQAAGFELFMLPFTAAAVLLARRARWATSGVAAAVGTLAKQTGGAVLLPVLALALRRRKVRPVLAVVVGFAVPVVAAALLLGSDDFMRWNLISNGSFAAPPPLGDALEVFVEEWLIWIGFSIPVVVLVAVAWRDRRRQRAEGAGEGDTDLWLWLLASALGVAVGWRFFGHYFLQLVPAVSLLATGVLARRELRRAAVVLGAVGAIAVGCAVSAYLVRSENLLGRRAYEAVADAVRDRSGPDDRLLIWGSAPEIYWASNRLPATRFITTLSFLAGLQPGRSSDHAQPRRANAENWADFLEDFDAHPPQVVVDTAPSGFKLANRAPIARYPVLASRLAADYCFSATVKGEWVYERRAGVSPHASSTAPRSDRARPVAPRCAN